MEFEAARLFDRTASTEILLELYDKAIEERGGGSPGSAATLEKRAALARRKDELELERKGYLRQNTRGKLSDGDLDAMLAEVDKQREATRAELRAVEDEAEALRWMEWRGGRWPKRASPRTTRCTPSGTRTRTRRSRTRCCTSPRAPRAAAAPTAGTAPASRWTGREPSRSN